MFVLIINSYVIDKIDRFSIVLKDLYGVKDYTDQIITAYIA